MLSYYAKELRRAALACNEAANKLEELENELATEQAKVRRLVAQNENMGRRIKNLEGVSEELERLREENTNLKEIYKTL